MFRYWLLVLHQCTTNVQMFGYWILVLHCTTSGADGGAAKFAFQHSTVSPLQVSQQVIIICNTLNDNYISTSWIIIVVYFSFFATVESPQSATCVGDSVRYPSISRSALFIHASKKSPSPSLPGQLGMGMREWVSSAGFILNAPPPISANHPPSNACLIPFPPDLTMSDHTVRLWPHSGDLNPGWFPDWS